MLHVFIEAELMNQNSAAGSVGVSFTPVHGI